MLLSGGEDAMDSQMQTQLFYPDDYAFDDADTSGARTSTGLRNKYSFTEKSKIFDMEGPLYEDVFRMNKYLVNGVYIRLKVCMNKASFVLMSDETTPSYKLKIFDVAFKACMVGVDSGFLINHADILKDTTPSYPDEPPLPGVPPSCLPDAPPFGT